MDSLEEKKNYLLSKYQKKFNLSEYKKYAVFRRDIGSQRLDDMELVCKCNTQEEAEHEIAWRLEYCVTQNKDIPLDNDKRFDSFYDSSKSLKKLEDFKDIPMEYSGEYFILPIYNSI